MYTLNDLLKKQRKNIKNFDKKLLIEEKRLEIALQISNARKSVGITQKKLAKKLHTTQSVVSRIENGNQNMSLDLICRIAKALNKNISFQFV